MGENSSNLAKLDNYRDVHVKEVNLRVIKCKKRQVDGQFLTTYQIWSKSNCLLCECSPYNAIDSVQLLGFNEIFR